MSATALLAAGGPMWAAIASSQEQILRSHYEAKIQRLQSKLDEQTIMAEYYKIQYERLFDKGE